MIQIIVMKFIIGFLLLIHGLIHLIGFIKAFQIAEISQFSQSIPKPMGIFWLFASILFLLVFFLFLIKMEYWGFIAIIAVILSQTLIFIHWQDAKFGTIINIIILIITILTLATFNFENTYKKDVINIIETINFNEELIAQKDIDSLPPVIQKYLHYVGLLGKPKIKNVKITFEGAMRDKGGDWFLFISEQYNFMESPARLFFMKAKIKGMPTVGYHVYKKNEASMLIKVLSLFPVINISEKEMYPTETVTYFNDLCLFAPGALIDKKIQWELIDNTSVKAIFTNKNTTISAVLYFNETGQLIDFVSNDRYSINDMKTYQFSTPVKNYKAINGYNLPTYGEAIWHYPDGDFVYGKFNIKSIEYNVPYLK